MIENLITKSSDYKFKVAVEKRKPKSWLKTVCAFANIGGGKIIFGVDDERRIVGLQDIEKDAADISQLISASISPLPQYSLGPIREENKDLIVLSVATGRATPYYYQRDGNRETYIRSGNETIPSFLAGAFGTFMLKEFFAQVPRPLFDAGIIDGVSSSQMFLRIYLPQATSPIATLFIIAFMNNWNDLLRPMLYISKRDMYLVTVALSQFQNQYGVRWNLLLAGSVLSVIPLIAVFAFSQRYIIESTMSSGIKG